MFKIASYTLGTNTHIIEGEILSDNPSPAISTKFYRAIYLPHPLNPPLLDMDIYSYHEGEDFLKRGFAPLNFLFIAREQPRH